MKVTVTLNLREYSVKTIKRLYQESIITRDEFIAELESRECDPWLASQIAVLIEEKRGAA